MSAWSRGPKRGLDPIRAEHKEHFNDSRWEHMYLPDFEPDISFTKPIREKTKSSQYGKQIPVVVRPEKVEEIPDFEPQLPKETEELRRKVHTHTTLHHTTPQH